MQLCGSDHVIPPFDFSLDLLDVKRAALPLKCNLFENDMLLSIRNIRHELVIAHAYCFNVIDRKIIYASSKSEV